MKLTEGRPVPKLHKACKTGSRYRGMAHVKVTRVPAPKAEKPDDQQPDMMRCIATDGRVLAVVEVEAHADDADGYVSADAWEAACKAKQTRWSPEFHALIANGACKVASKGAVTEYARPDAGEEFPKYESVLIEKGAKGRIRIVFNPRLLINLCDALGMPSEAESVALEIDPKNLRSAPIRVETTGGYGALMPITID